MYIQKAIKCFALLITFFITSSELSAQKKKNDKPVIKKSTPVKTTPKIIFTKPVRIKTEKKIPEKKVLLDVNLNYFGVSETTRNRIDNGDCKRIFGAVSVELWEVFNNNQTRRRLYPYMKDSEVLFEEKKLSPPPIAISYYQDNKKDAAENVIESVTYNIPLQALNERRIMLVVNTHIGSRHKDNDFASYDCLCMEKEKVSSFLIGNDQSQPIMVRTHTNERYSGTPININDFIVPFDILRNTDDTHFIWTQLTVRKK